MRRIQDRMMFTAAIIMPLSSLLAQYVHNAEFIDFDHVCIAGVLFMIISAVGYGVLWLLFHSSFSSLIGCVVMWGAFFAFADVGKALGNIFGHVLTAAAIYFSLALGLAILGAYLFRKVKLGFMGPLAFAMAVVMLLVNLFSSVQTLRAIHTGSNAHIQYKEDYLVDATLPSPNVYWIHADGMLGFDAMEQYFGDAQAELKSALGERGFGINEDAYLEAGHKTAIAVTALMNPYFFDEMLEEPLSTHESAMRVGKDSGFLRTAVNNARTFNETRLAFKSKGYFTQTLATPSIYFPPVTDRVYETTDDRGAYRIIPNGELEETFSTVIAASEFAALLTALSVRSCFRVFEQLGSMGIGRFKVIHEPIEYPLEREHVKQLLLNSADAKHYVSLLDSLNDALHTQGNTFNIVYFGIAHYPFIYDEFGRYTHGDGEDLGNYPAQHRFATKILLNMVDMILEKDPDAVIVLQADHGLHGQTRGQIEGKLGKEAVLPLWNQVFSALRVPDKYRNGQEHYAMENPLNISRYLINSFIGKNYAYITDVPEPQ